VIRWDLTRAEAGRMQNILHEERHRLSQIARMSPKEERRRQAQSKMESLDVLLASLAAACRDTDSESPEGADLICFCDTNFDREASLFRASWRVGDDPSQVYHEMFYSKTFSEYKGIMALLNALSEKHVHGSVVVFSDSLNCVRALNYKQKAAGYGHKKRAGNAEELRQLFMDTVSKIAELKANGCEVKFAYRSRIFINEALKLDIVPKDILTMLDKDNPKNNQRPATLDERGTVSQFAVQNLEEKGQPDLI
jgi:hypothetical protein